MTTFPAAASFLVCAVLLFFSSIAVSLSAGSTRREQFWIFFVAIPLQLGLISQANSLFWKITPSTWLVSQIILSILILVATRRSIAAGVRDWRHATGEFFRSLDVASLIVLCITLAIIVLVGFRQLMTAVAGHDELMYHASRAIYWIQNQSILGYENFNDRQFAFPMGAELTFFWPILFTKWELPGRMMFWLATPLATIGTYTVMREARASRKLSLVAAMLFIATPTIGRYAVGLKPELWTAACALGTVFWALRALDASSDKFKTCFMLAASAVLCANMKFPGLALLPAVFLIPLFAARRASSSDSLPMPTATPWVLDRASHLLAIIVGALFSLFFSGLALTFVQNFQQFGHPLGNDLFRNLHRPIPSAYQIWVHIVRTPIVLFEPPLLPFEPLRTALVTAGTKLIDLLGAATPLLHEDPRIAWPGPYKFQLFPEPIGFSTLGILWLPALAIGGFMLISDLFNVRRRSARPISILALFAIPSLLGVVFMIRWMGGGPTRFWIPAYALAVPIIVLIAHRWVRSNMLRRGVAWAIVGITLFSPLYRQYAGARLAWANRHRESYWGRPYDNAAAAINPGSTILAVGSQGSEDYLLFDSSERYANRLIPWGKSDFDADRMRKLIDANDVSYVLLDNEKSISFFFEEPISAEPIVEWLRAQNGFEEVLVTGGPIRLFQTKPNLRRPAIDFDRMPFCGWTKESGLDGVEGPIAEFPTLRWGRFPHTQLEFTDAGGPMQFKSTCMAVGVGASMIVEANGQEILRHTFVKRDWPRKDFSATFTAKSGDNVVTIRYERPPKSRDDVMRIVMFTKLQVVPESGGSNRVPSGL